MSYGCEVEKERGSSSGSWGSSSGGWGSSTGGWGSSSGIDIVRSQVIVLVIGVLNKTISMTGTREAPLVPDTMGESSSVSSLYTWL